MKELSKFNLIISVGVIIGGIDLFLFGPFYTRGGKVDNSLGILFCFVGAVAIAIEVYCSRKRKKKRESESEL